MRRFLLSLSGCAFLLSSCASSAYRADLRSVDVVIPSPVSGQNRSSARPGSLAIAVPFSPQAPFAVWDPLHEEACEEMSLIMVAAYWKKEPLTRQAAEERLQDLIAWETSHGYGEDTSAEETAEIARQYFGLRATVRTDVTAESIEQELRNGRPVIVPAAGRDLGNPFFSGEGPWFHMLVITGYKDGAFITNDPGTKRGGHFVYEQDILLNAIHDWTGVKEEIREGEKAMVIISQ